MQLRIQFSLPNPKLVLIELMSQTQLFFNQIAWNVFSFHSFAPSDTVEIVVAVIVVVLAKIVVVQGIYQAVRCRLFIVIT